MKLSEKFLIQGVRYERQLDRLLSRRYARKNPERTSLKSHALLDKIERCCDIAARLELVPKILLSDKRDIMLHKLVKAGDYEHG